MSEIDEETVEDVAKAIWDVRRAHANNSGVELEFWGDGIIPRACGVFDEARAAIAAMPSWRPIESAPKGKLLLVGFFNSAGKWRSMHAQYRDDLPQHDDADDDDEPAEAGWYEGSLEAEMLFPVSPTHWQPIPAPPKPEGGQT